MCNVRCTEDMVSRLDASLDFVEQVNTPGPPAVRAQVSVPYTNQGGSVTGYFSQVSLWPGWCGRVTVPSGGPCVMSTSTSDGIILHFSRHGSPLLVRAVIACAVVRVVRSENDRWPNTASWVGRERTEAS
jgi:hypothetical protein